MKVSIPEVLRKKIDLLVHSFEHICRFCTQDRFLQPIFLTQPDGADKSVFNQERQIGMLLSTYMEYDLEREIELPKYICDDCIDTLLRWHRFQLRCAATTELLLEALDERMDKAGDNTQNEQKANYKQRSDSIEPDLQIDEVVYDVTIEPEGEQHLSETNAKEEEHKHINVSMVHREEFIEGASSYNSVINNASKQTSDISPRSTPDNNPSINEAPIAKTNASGRQCPVCGIMVKAKLKHHLMRHADSDGRPFKCEQCDKAYRFDRTLVNHVKNVHDNLRFRCEVCSKQFCSTDVLRVHMKLHTNSEQQYRCEVCGRCFKQLMYLRKHRSVHDTESRFQCAHCGKTFRLKTQLKQHLRVHSGEKPHECPVCYKRFRSMNNLRQHNRTHWSEKPFRCSKCTTAFTNRQSLTRHKHSLKCRSNTTPPSEEAPSTGQRSSRSPP